MIQAGLLARLLAFGLLCACAVPAVTAEIAAVDAGWDYRWGDSPLSPDGTPVWALAADDRHWTAIDFPSNPPQRHGRENIWYRVPVPDFEARDPALFIFSVDLIVEVYLDGRRLYRFGDFDSEGRGAFAGWPWHLIALPQDAGGKMLYFRIYSNYKDIGLWGEILLGERLDLLRRVIEQSVERLITSGFSLLIALLALLFAPLERNTRGFGAIALFAFGSGLMVLSGAQANLLVLNRPLLWEYLGASGYFLIPIAIASLLEQWLHPSASRLLVAIRWLHLCYLFGAIGLAWLGWISLADTYPVFDAIFTLTLVLMLLPALKLARSGNSDQQLILIAVALLAVLLLLDMAVAHGVLAWRQVPLAWGVLGFSLAIVVISIRHFRTTQRELAVLNTSLERQVRARTAELEQLAAREARRARMLELENRKSAELERLITRLQGCERLAASEAVLSDALPVLCSPLSGGFFRIPSAGQSPEPRASWGARPDLRADDRKSELAPVEEAVREPAARPGDPRRWAFRLHYEHPNLGDLDFGLLIVRGPEKNGPFACGDEPGLWRDILRRAVEKINLTLSLLALQDELRILSYEDGLTGLKNRRFLDEMLARETAVAERQQRPLSLLICDVDHFKPFNDSHGHAAGDAALKQVAAQISRVFRDTDLVCRYGGEEFLVLMPAADGDAARERGEALREQVAAASIQHRGASLGQVTISIGIASYPEPVGDARALMLRADQALYRAKQGGRNRVELAD